ncbi:MAG: DNA replication ATP-dependent helicase Dna2 [Bacillariaceae sp.]|jgi:DNA replication ATP-dependent helicase Dna2
MNEDFQEINDNYTSDGDNGEDESNYLNEMTQDVIEWDERKNTDLCQMYRSPQPPPGTSCSRGTTKRKTRSSSSSSSSSTSNGKKKRTPTSASSTNSSLFLDVKRQLDPLCRNGILNDNISNINNNNTIDKSNNNNNNNDNNDNNKQIRIEKAETEINGILDVLNMEGGTTSNTYYDDNNNNNNNNARAKYAFSASPLSTNSLMPTPKRHNNNKQLAKGELRRHHTHPKTHNQNNQQLKSSSTSLALRHRRRRTTEYTTDNEQFGRQQRKEQSINLITSMTSAPASTTVFTTPAINNLNNLTDNRNIKSTTSSAHDDFAVLLDAITTPNNISTGNQLSRSPLASVDENTTISITTMTMTEGKEESKDTSFCTKKLKDTFTDAARKSENDADLDRSMKNDIISPQLPAVSSTFQSNSIHRQTQSTTDSKKSDRDTSHRVRGNDNTDGESRSNDDEFDDIKFSEDDIAAIDSLTVSQPNTISDKIASSSETNKTEHSSIIKDASDEYGDFLSDGDLAKLDAIVSTQSCQPKTLNTTYRPQQEVVATTTISAKAGTNIPPAGQENILSSGNKHELHDHAIPVFTDSKSDEAPSPPTEDEDEFGNFPDDIDFSALDQVVTQRLATQCDLTRTDDSEPPTGIKHSTKMTVQINDSKSNNTLSPTEEEDEFGEFPDDIDFNALCQPNVRVNMEDNVVLNRKTNPPKCGELSFMKFSRYKVLTVDDDEKRNTKSLSVAAWDNSMMKSDEEEKKIHKDYKMIKSSCNILNFSQYAKDGLITLRGEWYYSPVQPGDVVHVCSLTGRYQTDVTALPIILHTYPPPGSDIDDLILVLHPDMLMTPSVISETSSCNRRAVLKSKIGSNGLSSKAAFVGTMRHALFEACMKTAEFDEGFAQPVIKKLIREKAETLIGCNVSEAEMEVEVLNMLPMIQQFAEEYTTLRKDVMILDPIGKPVGGNGLHPDIRLLAKGVHSVEESVVSTELGLKGAIDAVLETETMVIGRKHNNFPSNSAVCDTNTAASPQQSLMCFELKTGHNQNAQAGHMAQLSLYTFMLQSRYGSRVRLDGNLLIGSQSEMGLQKGAAAASVGGVLLYLNHQSQQINHVAPHLGEIKTLMSQRNVVASGLKKASSPRGISLSYAEGTREDDDQHTTTKSAPIPAANLPELANPHSCKRCFSNRECMLYAASGSATDVSSHQELLSQFTGHLKEEDLAYFNKWERLIDIEADATNSAASAAWLVNSRLREIDNGESISGLIMDAHASYAVDHSRALICFRRNIEEYSQSSLDNLNFTPGSQVIVSTDGTLFDDFAGSTHPTRKFRHHKHITKGYIDRIEDDKVFVSATCDELDQMKVLTDRYIGNQQHTNGGMVLSESLLFRLDKNKNSVGTGTLRWNLINFLTGDYKPGTAKECTELDRIKQLRLSRLRDIVIRLKTPEFVDNLRSSLFNGIDRQVSGCSLSVLKDEFSQLNNDQQEAVRMAISGRDYTLIQGLPGTGKTSTLTFLARLFMAQGRRVLVTAYTHSAVDNIMSKLIEKGMGSLNPKSGTSDLVRIGKGSSCHESVRSILHSELARELDNISENRDADIPDQQSHPSVVSLKGIIAGARIVGVTALSLPRSPLLQNEIFDVVIIDEAGQMNEPATLGAISCADKFILVGDHKQLPPLVNSVIAENGGYGISVLKRLADSHPHAIAQLTMQYRMNEAICQISSEATYGGLLKCGNDNVKLQLLQLPAYPTLLPTPVNFNQNQPCFSWLRSVIDPQRPVIFVDTDNIRTGLLLPPYSNPSSDSTAQDSKFEALEGRAGGSIVNRTEATLVRYIVKALHLCGHELSDIGVISPFRAQIRVLEESSTITSLKKEGLELSTIDKYQGRDKSTIVISLVRSNERNNVGRLLQDEKRLNVALTRAKKKVVVLGSFKTLKNGSAHLQPILNRMNMRNQRFLLPDNAIECYNIP